MLKQILQRISLLFILIFSGFFSFAQQAQSSLDDTMRSHDKIYVVLAVCLVILLVVLFYLIRIDVKISKKEKNG